MVIQELSTVRSVSYYNPYFYQYALMVYLCVDGIYHIYLLNIIMSRRPVSPIRSPLRSS